MVTFKLVAKPAGAALAKALTQFFAQRDEQRLSNWKFSLWPKARLEGTSINTTLTLDTNGGVFTLPLEPANLPALQRVLLKGTTKLEMSWASASDVTARKRAEASSQPAALEKAPPTPAAARRSSSITINQRPLTATVVHPCSDTFEPRHLAVTTRGLVAHGTCGLYLVDGPQPPACLLVKAKAQGFEQAVLARGDALWVSGNNGILHADGVGKPFRPPVTPSFGQGVPLPALAHEADGSVWAAGNDGSGLRLEVRS